MKGPLWGKWSCVSDLWPSPQAPPPAARPTKLPCEKLKQNREQMFRFLSLQNKGALQVSTIAVPNARATYGVPRDSAARVAAPAEASFAPTYAWAPGGELPARGPRPPAADRPLPNALRSVAESMRGRFRAGAVGSALQDLLKNRICGGRWLAEARVSVP